MELADLKPTPHQLKTKLRKARLTVADVAAYCGTSQTWMGLILSGHETPNAAIAEKLNELESLLDTNEANANSTSS